VLIEKAIAQFVVFGHQPLLTALVKIEQNKSGLVVVTTEKGQLLGTLTDGDIRRQFIVSEKIGLQTPVGQIINAESTSAPIDAPSERIASLFSERIKAVPLLDAYERVVAIAFRDRDGFQIGGRAVGRGQPAYVIAEIGNNHNGDVELGKRLIDAAIASGADCAKFQLRDLRFHYGADLQTQNVGRELSVEYTLDILSRYNLCSDDLLRLFDYCRERGIEPLCTPWDIPSVEVVNRNGLAAFKVASADLTNSELLMAIVATRKPIICSTGMANEAEIKHCILSLRSQGAPFRLLHCNSTYPTPYKDVNLQYMHRLEELSGAPVGYSGHERGWTIPIAAVAMGACIIEKHLTLDRAMEGNDHKISLLPSEFAEMIRAIRAVEESIGNAAPRLVSQGEKLNRIALAKNLCAKRDIFPGEVISKGDIALRTIGQGLPVGDLNKVAGLRATRAIKAGAPLVLSDLQEKTDHWRRFAFGRPWGVPVRWHDYRSLMAQTNLTLLEYHVSFVDMEANLEQWFVESLAVDFVIHAPELFRGDHILDLASPNKQYRERSIIEMQKVIDLTRALKRWHPRTAKPLIVTNVGGMSTAAAYPKVERQEYYRRVEDSLAKLDREGVEIVLQNMPPFPWHFGGQAFHNLFMDPDEIVLFCRRNAMRMCLDISHAQLFCNHARLPLRQFCELVAPHTAHLHLADARGSDGEGLQIGDGVVDFSMVSQVCADGCPAASFIPEIWLGHQDNGVGFWSALKRLEEYFGGRNR
jgi:N-acetylneuraminate synthase